MDTTGYFIIAIFILVTAHELGHFLTAKLFGMRVEKFYIGFDFWNLRLWSKQIGETEYGIGLIPLGGYVKISGMVDESFDTDFQGKPPQPWEFRAKPVWQRLIVLAGGVAMNMLLAAAIFVGVTMSIGESRTSVSTPAYVEQSSVFADMGMQTGDLIQAVNGKAVESWEEALDPEFFTASTLTYTLLRNGQELTVTAPSNIMSLINDQKGLGIRPVMPPLIGEVLPDMPARAAGIQPNSVIVAINGKSVVDWHEVVGTISANAGKPLQITWKHLAFADGKEPSVADIRASGEMFVATIVPTEAGKIGMALQQTIASERRKLGIGESLTSGVQQTWKATVMTVQGFGKILTGKEDLSKSVGGPLKIAEIAGQSARQGVLGFLFFLAMLSISLAVINILPIPALDGGQFVLNAIEGIIGRELPFELKMRMQQIGVALLMSFFAFIFINDILNFFKR